MKKYIAILMTTACLVSVVSAGDLPKAKTYPKVLKNKELSETQNRLKKLEKKLEKLNKKLNKVKKHDAYDNVKFGIDFRNTYDNINYKYNKYSFKGKDWSGKEHSNDALFTSRLILTMKAQPVKNITFNGELVAYGVWGSHVYEDDSTLKGWSASSKPTDTLLRVRKAYFSYADKINMGKYGLPYTISIGRRPAYDGFLANHRENMTNPNSPLAHITNMEFDAAMVQFDTNKYLTSGSFIKLIYGRAHSGGLDNAVYDKRGYMPFAEEEGDLNENVDAFVIVSNLYYDGQYKLMFQNATILNAKGKRAPGSDLSDLPLKNGEPKNFSLDAGTANLTALSLEINGIGEEISDFLDETTVFASLAMTNYSPESGKEYFGSTDDKSGNSLWIGATIPDLITDSGKFGFEYNHGSQYWTPMTWGEDTAIGSKIAVRGDAFEAYWNFNFMGSKYLPAQIRYTHIQHDYTPNIRCSGWVPPEKVDIEADDIRVSVSYKY